MSRAIVDESVFVDSVWWCITADWTQKNLPWVTIKLRDDGYKEKNALRIILIVTADSLTINDE